MRRYPAYPLITCDPYLNVWSMSDELNNDYTRHWTGEMHPLTGIILVDGMPKMFMGKFRNNPTKNDFGPEKMEQKSVKVTPLKTIYTFADDKIELEVTFMTPLVLDDLKLMSRPISYIIYKIKSLDGKKHNCKMYIDVSALLVVDKPDEKICIGKTNFSSHISNCKAASMGIKDTVLEKSGDDTRISWGHLHFAGNGGWCSEINDGVKGFCFRNPGQTASANIFYKMISANDDYPCAYFVKDYEVESYEVSDFVCIGLDDIHSIEYFGKSVDAYYKKDGEKFSTAFKDAIDNFDAILKKAEEFDARVLADAREISEEYADLMSISYRQTIAAHKLAYDGKQGLFISKECFSNGCAATVDVTYPSIPLFLKYNPDLVEYMLNPVFDYAYTAEWDYEFAPHDVGQYPLVNGQVYGLVAGELQYESQMPVEECGNMLLCVAALCRAKNNADYAKKHFDILEQWANYLIKYGYDPENQLCTDDFAGHLAHNCNLSVKAIMGIAAWGMLLEMMGNAKSEEYIKTAKELAARWKNEAFVKDHYRLAFDKEETWSIKYNLVWDKLFGLGIFDNDIFTTEVEYYKTRINECGLPLDSRSDYTKSDWQMWSTVLTDDTEYRDMIISAMLHMLEKTGDRVPFTDFYYSSTGVQVNFQNRTVQGGLFINLLNFE